MWTDPGNIKIAHIHMNVEIGTETTKFPEKKYKNVISLQCRKPDPKVLPPSVSAPRSEEWSGRTILRS